MNWAKQFSTCESIARTSHSASSLENCRELEARTRVYEF
jgi:hypothetical protein